MATPTHDAPVLIIENAEADWLPLSQAVRRGGINQPLMRLPNAASVELYLNGTGRYSNRQKYPYPCLILLDVTLPKLITGEMLPWLKSPPPNRQIAVTSTCGPLDPDQFESAVAFGPNSVLCKLSSVESLAAMIRVLYQACLVSSLQAASC